jgi:hypothetical protein
MKIGSSLRQSLRYTISKLLLAVFAYLSLFAVNSCGLQENSLPSVNEEYSTQELNVSGDMTVLDLATVAEDLIDDWQPRPYLHSLLFRLGCDGFVRSASFEYITKRPRLWYERQVYARVKFDFEKGKVKLHREDVNDAGLLDTRLNLDELETDVHHVVAITNAQGGAAYCKQTPEHYVNASLDRDVWTISYGRRGELIHDLVVTFDAHIQ